MQQNFFLSFSNLLKFYLMIKRSIMTFLCKLYFIIFVQTGLGVSMFILIATLSTFYIVIICWTIYYLVKSFTKSLPWSSCDNSWNTPFCLERGTTDTLTAENNGSEFQQSSKLCPSIFCNWYNNTGQNNVTQMRAFEPISTNVTGHWRTPAEEFWK